MPIGIGGVSFEGPYTRHEILCRRPGVFAVLDGRSLPPLHAEKTDDVRRAVEDHDGRRRWQEQCDNLAYAVFYTAVDRSQRRIERAVREEFDLIEDGAEEAAANGGTAANGDPAAGGEERPPAGSRERPNSGDGKDRRFRFHVPSGQAAYRRPRVS